MQRELFSLGILEPLGCQLRMTNRVLNFASPISHTLGPGSVEDLSPPSHQTDCLAVTGGGTNEEPQRPVVSGERPSSSTLLRGDPLLGHLIDSAGMVILRLSRAVS
jgi:hypothetical protein